MPTEKEKRLRLLELEKERRRRQREKGVTPEGIESASGFFVESAKSTAAEVLSGAGAAAEQVGRYTAAPFREGITEAFTQEGGTGAKGFAEGFFRQFGEPTEEATSGEEQLEMAFGMEEGWPRTILGLGAEMVQDPLNIVSAVSATAPGKAASRALRSRALGKSQRKAAQAIAQMSKQAIKDEEVPEVIGKVVLEHDLEKLLSKPRKFREALTGKTVLSKIDPDVDDFDYVARREGSGLIGELSDDLQSKIRSVSELPNAPTISKNKLFESLEEAKFNEMADELPGVAADDRAFKRYSNKLKNELKVSGVDKKMTLEEAQRAKQRIGKRLNKSIFERPADKGLALEKDVLRDIYQGLKQSIEEGANKIEVPIEGVETNFGDYIRGQNLRLKKLIEISDNLKDIPAKELTRANIIENAVKSLKGGLSTAGAFGLAGYNPMGGFVLGAGGRSAADAVSGAAPRAARFQKFLGKKGIEKGRKAVSGAGPTRTFLQQMADEEEGRVPQSIEIEQEGAQPQSTPVQTGANVKNDVSTQPKAETIPEAIVRARLPRTTEELLEQKDLVKAKVAQMAPEMFDGVSEALDNPYQVSKIMPLVIKRFPNLFMPDRYNRFDGKVISKEDMAEATKDIEMDDNFSDYEKAEIISHMNKTGELIGVD